MNNKNFEHRTEILHNEVLEAQPEEKEKSKSREVIMRTIDQLIKTYIHFAPKDNEGQQALIFKYDLETNASSISPDDQEGIEKYIGESKSIKVLKVTNKEAAATEFGWHEKAYKLYQEIPDDKKDEYAGIPRPYINHTIEIDDGTKERLNNQNANISSDSASVMVMEWVEGEDLLTKLFRHYLAGRPGYESTANNRLMNFRSLLIAVSGDFRTRGMDFNAMQTLEQYQRLFKSVTKDREILTVKQQKQIENTLQLLHANQIYHNDLHLRNYLIEDETDKVFLIDFGNTTDREQLNDRTIKDEMVLNFAREYRTEKGKDDALRKALDVDIKRIIDRDQSLKSDAMLIRKKEGTELIKFIERESSDWRLDTWKLKRFVAIIALLKQTSPDKSEILIEFMKEKGKGLNVEAQNIIALASH